MQLNCDLGESYGLYVIGNDEAIMPYLDLANIACGYHGGDAQHIQKAISLAKQHNVKIGAHPSYPDKQGFGRRSMQLSNPELYDHLAFQVASLQGLCAFQNTICAYVKPHGALYHDIVENAEVRDVFFSVVEASPNLEHVVLPAGPWAKELVQNAQKHHITVVFEAFADRAYDTTGKLVSRTHPNAVLSLSEAIVQAQQIMTQQVVTCIDGTELPLHAETLCVHSDSEDALAIVAKLAQLCE
jgi:UPF0271 protein